MEADVGCRGSKGSGVPKVSVPMEPLQEPLSLVTDKSDRLAVTKGSPDAEFIRCQCLDSLAILTILLSARWRRNCSVVGARADVLEHGSGRFCPGRLFDRC
jgi:hypothetical protein